MATKSFSVSCKCRSVRIVAGESLDSNKRLFNTLELPAFLNPKLFQVFRLYSKSIVTQHEANIKVSNRNSGFYHIMCRSCQFDFFVKIIENNAYLIIPNNYADSIVVEKDVPFDRKEIFNINDLILIDGAPSSPVMINESPVIYNENRLEYDDSVFVEQSQFDNENPFVIGSFSDSPILYEQLLFA